MPRAAAGGRLPNTFPIHCIARVEGIAVIPCSRAVFSPVPLDSREEGMSRRSVVQPIKANILRPQFIAQGAIFSRADLGPINPAGGRFQEVRRDS
jgi:hypothetical protein